MEDRNHHWELGGISENHVKEFLDTFGFSNVLPIALVKELPKSTYATVMASLIVATRIETVASRVK